jgi:hypothetical protein
MRGQGASFRICALNWLVSFKEKIPFTKNFVIFLSKLTLCNAFFAIFGPLLQEKKKKLQKAKKSQKNS